MKEHGINRRGTIFMKNDRSYFDNLVLTERGKKYKLIKTKDRCVSGYIRVNR